MLTPRRRFLVGAGSLLAAGLSLAACKPNSRNAALSPQAQTLTSLVDTIIPKDAFAGALELGLDARLTAQAKAQPDQRILIDRLSKTVSELSLRQHRAEFYQLDIDRREQLLTRLLAATNNVVARQDLQKLRNTLLSWYYQSDSGAASIDYQLPARYPAYPG